MKGTRFAIILLGVALAAAGCSSGSSGSTSTTAAAAKTCNGSIGFMGPITGPAASIGAEQLDFAQYAVQQYNAAHHTSYKLVQGDTQLNPSIATTVATSFVSNGSILGVVGPAGSQEVLAVGPIFNRAGMGFISGSATKTTLTTGPTRIKGFFRTVPNDAEQGPTDARYMINHLGAKNVLIVNDEEAYSTGLAASATAVLKAHGVTVTNEGVPQSQTDFSALVSKVSSSTNVVFLPWQIATNAQLFGEQMQAQHKTAVIFGSDGTDSPSEFHINGAYVSSFAPDIHAIAADASTISGYTAKYGASHFQTTFGPPTYLATEIVATAISHACGMSGGATRANVEAAMSSVTISPSILGGTFAFTKTGDPVGAHFYIFKIENGKYVLVM